MIKKFTIIVILLLTIVAYGKKIDHFDLEAKMKSIDALEYPDDKKDILKRCFENAYEGDANAQFKIGVLYHSGKLIGQDYKEAARFYKYSAEAGNKKAQINLASLFLFTKEITRNPHEAARLLKLAHKNGGTLAANNLGVLYELGYGVDKDYAQAADFYQEAADKGDCVAQEHLAALYRFGIGRPLDYRKAFELSELALKNGNLNAYYSLGIHYERGLGLEKDYVEAKRYYRLSIEHGNKEAQVRLDYLNSVPLAMIEKNNTKIKELEEAASIGKVEAQKQLGAQYLKGSDGVEKNKFVAMEFIARAAEQGDSNAEYTKGHYLFSLKHFDEAFPLLEKAALKGHKGAQCDLGIAYNSGFGVKKDQIIAFLWFKKSAEQNYAPAQYWLGIFYQNGVENIAKDYKQAFTWFEKAANQGDAIAENQVGWFFRHGLGVDKNLEEAFKWYKKAALHGDNSGQNNLGYALAHGEAVEKNLIEAREWYEKSAINGSRAAMVNLAMLFEVELGDWVNAKKWYEKAAEKENSYAQYRLGHIYENGLCVEIDKDKARELYALAAAQNQKQAIERLKVMDKSFLQKYFGWFF